ncbi:MAG: excinuclease ABC subunit UvrB [bacterium]|uniref:UvrABC system protein B n=2 Tax=Bacteria candidate phyla TaxID=1783234 RepID=A0A101I000_UNCT6|nr:MAG: UvrABC system protein B [candidate division TA06 bacterium 32_111]KUK86511.1 MAG: UvrABC system protein B [candidate division TA06 bacterium 34_109]MDI6699622.1 excinuclease ABC subunit UvrB [bacterium]HAF08269.1 excinuclease ABC subunit B [candidate division WOR-3 bacterium]HCP17252.1 excinuclease ABC subunit B [candidate division WOR-3 bacterium]
MNKFKIVSRFSPSDEQEKAIDKLVEGVLSGKKYQVLLGITGSGKTFTIANVIERLNKPTLIISHNKTLAAQLYGELKTLFPENSVEYFISYYDYYQPEAYLPDRDIYIEKEVDINEYIDKMRLKATVSLYERNDVIVVASVSSIYTLGSPSDYYDQIFSIKVGDLFNMERLIDKLITMQYQRNDIDFSRGRFRVLGNTIDLFPSHLDIPVKIIFDDQKVDEIYTFDSLNNSKIEELETLSFFPAKHFVTSDDRIKRAVVSIRKELKEREKELRDAGKILEATRLVSRTNYDLELLKEVGYCPGIENYSRHIDGRKEGERPFTLIDYFKGDFLTVIDESHVTIPQIRGMYNGDRSRKLNLVEYGFRLKSALDNRPLTLEEFERITGPIVCMSATPDRYEVDKAKEVVELVIRPTGLVDPEILIKSSQNQIEDLIENIKIVVERNERVLVTTLTKKMAESLSKYLEERGIRVKYMHSEIDSIERVSIIRGLRLKEFDVLVGINLLREGLDLPEVSLVAILDADKEGFLRSETSLIQTIGRASRNVNGKVILYADRVTDSMKRAVEITRKRREKQIIYNREHNIVPKTISKNVEDILVITDIASSFTKEVEKDLDEDFKKLSTVEKIDLIEKLTEKMHKFAAQLEFEKAAKIRDKIKEIKKSIE